MPLRIIAAFSMLLAALGLGLILYVGMHDTTANHRRQQKLAQTGPTEQVIVAAHPLPAGTLARDTDFVQRTLPVASVPAAAIRAGKGAITGLRGALIRRYIDNGSPVLIGDILRPRDRGFLAAVLAPGRRAVSVGVNAVTGVSGLIWPGDHVDVLLTQQLHGGATPLAESVFSETVLKNVRVIAIDQKIVQGASGNAVAPAAAAQPKLYRTVTLEVTPDEAEKVAVADRLGPLSLSVRPAEESAKIALAEGRGGTTTMFASNVSPALAKEQKPVGARMNIIEGGSRREVTFP